ncbi:MAG: hypothetical protein U5M51_11845 [Emticicia sp.]|nr:hypothetical protein [Emticicia sp.]
MKTFATLTITLLSFCAFSQQKPPFIPRPAVSFFLNEKLADSKKTISKSDTLLEVKAILQGEQKQKMPDVTFLVSEVEVALIRNEKKIAGLVLLEGKGSLAPLKMLISSGDKYQMTVRGIKFLHDGIYTDIGTGDVIKDYAIE